MDRGNLFIISGPSGAGEDSVIEGLREYLPIERVITTTSRPMREGDKQGSPYYFISREEFEQKIKNGELAEWAKEYNDNFYGVTKEELDRVSESGRVGIWKIEYKGVIFAKKNFPEVRSIYIAPPSLEILAERIRRRNPEVSEEYIEERMDYTREWMRHEDVYDFKVVNEEGKLNETIQKVAKIIKNNLSSEKLN
ncbi:MAG: guanylate kinase [Patescibacteria group bacterium]